MAKTLQKIIYATLMEVQAYGKEAYDKLPDQMYWIDKINTWRAAAIRDIGDKKMYPAALFQPHTGIEIKKLTQTTTLNGMPLTVDKNLYYADIPELIGMSWKEISHFGTNKRFVRKNVSDFMNLEGNRYTKHMPTYCVIDNGRILVKNLPTMNTRFVAMIAIWAHPHLIPGYEYETSSYPISEMMLPKIEYLLKKEVFEYLGIASRQQKEEAPAEQ